MGRHWILLLIIFCAIGLVSACGDTSAATAPAGQVESDNAPGARELPTLYPTATPLPSPIPADTRAPKPTAIPATQIPFDQLVVDVRYTIPALSLDRRIRGNVAGDLEVIDENTGTSLTLRNRAGVILEMQQALPRAAIEELPSECDACVHFEYSLPLTQEAGEGWLNDAQILASLENYTALFLGPHFPPGTVIGLRREATPYEVAHSAAFTADGQLWSWTATEAEISAPEDSVVDVAQIERELSFVDFETLPDSLGQACYQGAGREMLLMAGPDGPRLIELRCPELYLPGQLQPLYLSLIEAVRSRLMGSEPGPPELPMSVEDVLAYRRSDGSSLTLKQDGRLNAIDGEGIRFTSTLTVSRALSLTSLLLDSTLLQPGASITMSEAVSNVIILRAGDGVYELTWSEVDTLLETVIKPWDDLLDRMIRGLPEDNNAEPALAPTATGDS